MELLDYISLLGKAFFYIGVIYTGVIFLLFVITRIGNIGKLDRVMLILDRILIFIWILTIALYIAMIVMGQRWRS